MTYQYSFHSYESSLILLLNMNCSVEIYIVIEYDLNNYTALSVQLILHTLCL